MNICRLVEHGAIYVALASALTWGARASAEEGTDAGEAPESDEVTFDVGGSCAALAYMNAGQLRAFINAGYTDDFHSFCYPEEPSECSDYTPFMKGLGRLSTGDDGFHCSLQLQL